MDTMISNTGKTRFLFGTFTNVDTAPVFHGAVVYGTDLRYDPETNLPIAGTVARIEVQSRSTTSVLTTHATYPDINTPVTDLNAAFADAQAPWFDATEVLPSVVIDDTAPLDLNVELDPAELEELVSGKNPLHLKTGEVFSAHELSGIFADDAAKSQKRQRARTKKRNARRKARTTNVHVLNATFENAATSNFSDLDIEALENELRVGAV
ncbi:hypothetical protein [Octadecabacter ascidiaceicola]|uniref:Uncharacterized protein n=1 Tax=Octadecabacter ascidiaceicola TaxID=1655543 RepID=A0A238JKK9_9RHOB|nr:hypothetical protein [Octadecabacter ascidiaceicola]SMX31171.1 hypothetical protein OCA8868_00226 [Octadecabacter ascidiaceicola]